MSVAVLLSIIFMASGIQNQNSGRSASPDSTLSILSDSGQPPTEEEYLDQLVEEHFLPPGELSYSYLRQRASYRHNDPSRPSSPLASGLEQVTYLRLRISPSVEFTYAGKKDRWEQYRWNRTRGWSGYDLNRASVSIAGRLGSLLIGSFRISHGFQIASGSARGGLRSKSNPLSQPRNLQRMTPYGGVSSSPVRNGVAMGYSGRVQVMVFASRTRHAASLSSKRTDQGMLVHSVGDVSSTSAFRTETSLSRRDRIRATSVGLGAILEYKLGQFALLYERLRAIDRFDGGTIGTRSYLSAGWSMGYKRLRIVTETVLANRGQIDYHFSTRLGDTGSGSLRLDVSSKRGPAGFLFGQWAKFNRTFEARRVVDIGWRSPSNQNGKLTAGIISVSTFEKEYPLVRKRATAYLVYTVLLNNGLALLFNTTQRMESTGAKPTSGNIQHFSPSTLSQSSFRIKLDLQCTEWLNLNGGLQALRRAENEIRSGVTVASTWGFEARFRSFRISASTSVASGSGSTPTAYFGEPTVTGAFPVGRLSGQGRRSAFSVKTVGSSRLVVELAYSEVLSAAASSPTRGFTIQTTLRARR